MCVLIFFVAFRKILIPLRLLRGYLRLSGQNLGSKGLTGKILRNKELAAEAGPVVLFDS